MALVQAITKATFILVLLLAVTNCSIKKNPLQSKNANPLAKAGEIPGEDPGTCSQNFDPKIEILSPSPSTIMVGTQVTWKVSATGCANEFLLDRLESPQIAPTRFSGTTTFTKTYSTNGPTRELIRVSLLNESGKSILSKDIFSETFAVQAGAPRSCKVVAMIPFVEVAIDATTGRIKAGHTPPPLGIVVEPGDLFSTTDFRVNRVFGYRIGSLPFPIPTSPFTPTGLRPEHSLNILLPDLGNYGIGAEIEVPGRPEGPITCSPEIVQVKGKVIDPLPAIAITLNGQSVDTVRIKASQSVSIGWVVTGSTTCGLTPGSAVTSSGTISYTGNQLGTNKTTAFALTCSGPGGTTTKNFSVAVNAPVNIYRNQPSARCNGNGGSAFDTVGSPAAFNTCEYTYRDDCWGQNPGSNGNIKAEMDLGVCFADERSGRTPCSRRDRIDDGHYYCKGKSWLLRTE